MKIWITVPSEFTEISNGRLIRKTPQRDNQTRYEWFVSYPINNYNVTFNIGKYVHYTDRYISDDTLTIDYYVMPYNLNRSKKMFTQVKPMLECFEKNFGKYPFKNGGFTLIESIYPMEHQSGVCIGKINQENSGDTNPLMWHESAHEWWGNSITSKDIADMWIHEAFATYAETQVIEHRFGKELAYESMLEQVDAVHNEEPVIGVYDVNHIHYDIADMYSKGSLMLHTFRNVLNNDTLWVNLLRDIQQHFRYQTITSDELIAYINQQTKTDYTYLFDQYLRYTNVPILELESQEKDNNLIVKYRWQADVKNFRMPVKVTTATDHFEFIYPTSDWKTITLNNLSAHEFDVDEEHFYIEVSMNE
jgi:aminopeptidase N